MPPVASPSVREMFKLSGPFGIETAHDLLEATRSNIMNTCFKFKSETKLPMNTPVVEKGENHFALPASGRRFFRLARP